MKIAVMGAGEFAAARIIESFHLGEGPTLAAIAQHPAELTVAARFVVDLRVADFASVESLSRSFAGCSAVVHAARCAPSEMKRGASVLCRAAAQAGVRRIVFLGSADVHGPCPPVDTDEKSRLQTEPGAEWRNGLVLAERQFFADCRQFDLAGWILRAGFLYGPRSSTIANLAAAVQEGKAWLLQRGDGICNSLYVDNLVTAVRLALKAKTGAGSAFLLTDAETITWRDFYLTAAHELNVSPNDPDDIKDSPSPRRSTRKERSPESAPSIVTVSPRNESPTAQAVPPFFNETTERQQCRWKLPITRATKELGYRPIVSFAEAMRRSCAWWRFAQGEF